MKTIYPSYLDKFNCIADKCPDTCCAGWKVCIDNNTYKKYKSVKGEFKKELNRLIIKGKTPCFKLKNGRCAFLDEQNLCKIYSTLGKESLSEVCKSHPRFIENFGAIKEITLSLSCPESVRLLYDEDLSFVEHLDDTLPVLNEIDTKIFNYLNESRTDLFNFIFDKNLNLSEILGGIINLKDILQEEIDDATFIKIEYEKADEFRFNIDLVQDIIKTLSKCTFTRKNIKNTISKITNLIFTDNFINELNDYLNTTPHKNFIIKILAIYIFRFYLTAVYDGKILDKINLCLYSILYIICAFYVESTLDDNTYNYLNIVKEYSREIFHCDKNVKYIIKTVNKKNLI